MANLKQLHRQPDVRDMLLAAGIGQYNAVLSIPYMMMLPRTTDPYAQGVMQIVEGLQNLLNRKGARLAIDGGMGEATLRALIPYAGPRWYDKSWVQLYGDVLRGEKWQGVERVTRAVELDWSLGDYGAQYRTAELGGFVDDVMANPLPWLGAAAALWLGRKRIRRWLKS
jgi:hypothetical protein